MHKIGPQVENFASPIATGGFGVISYAARLIANPNAPD
jgi:hypothetical protein